MSRTRVMDETAIEPSLIALSIECECASMIPGVTNFPVASITLAPLPAVRFLPIREMRPSRMRMSADS